MPLSHSGATMGAIREVNTLTSASAPRRNTLIPRRLRGTGARNHPIVGKELA
jgi:hypothetical protein